MMSYEMRALTVLRAVIWDKISENDKFVTVTSERKKMRIKEISTRTAIIRMVAITNTNNCP